MLKRPYDKLDISEYKIIQIQAEEEKRKKSEASVILNVQLNGYVKNINNLGLCITLAYQHRTFYKPKVLTVTVNTVQRKPIQLLPWLLISLENLKFGIGIITAI